MIVCAALVDILQILVSTLVTIPLIGFAIVFTINPLITFVASMVFGIWGSHLGMSLLSPKRALGFSGTILLELIPIFDDLPGWTVYIAYTVFREWRRKTDI